MVRRWARILGRRHRTIAGVALLGLASPTAVPVAVADSIPESIRQPPHADPPSGVFPLQAEASWQLMWGPRVDTGGVCLSLAYAFPLRQLGRGWQLFAGVGPIDDVTIEWRREDRVVGDAVGWLHGLGIEGRIGLIRGHSYGGPRFVLKAAPLWARGAAPMTDLPGERGIATRISVGAAWPWAAFHLMDAIFGELDDSDDALGVKIITAFFLAPVPSGIEYVFIRSAGESRHGFAFTWSF